MAQIRMKHSDIAGVAYAANEQVFAAVWAPRGWEALGGGEAEAFATEQMSRPIQDLDELKVEDLATLTQARGFKPAKGNKKADHVAALKAAFDGTGEALEAAPTPGFQPGVVDPTRTDPAPDAGLEA